MNKKLKLMLIAGMLVEIYMITDYITGLKIYTLLLLILTLEDVWRDKR